MDSGKGVVTEGGGGKAGCWGRSGWMLKPLGVQPSTMTDLSLETGSKALDVLNDKSGKKWSMEFLSCLFPTKRVYKCLG